MGEELRLLQEQIYAIPEHGGSEDDGEDSATVAIPKRVLSANARKGLRGTAAEDDDDEPDTSAIPQRHTSTDDEAAASDAVQPESSSDNTSVSDNPRAGWR